MFLPKLMKLISLLRYSLCNDFIWQHRCSTCRCRCMRIVNNRQTVSHDSRSALGKCSVQQRTVGQMNPILLWWKIRHLCFQFQHFQNVDDLPGDIIHGTKFQLVVNLPTQRKAIRHSTIGHEKSSLCEDDSVLLQKSNFVLLHQLVHQCDPFFQTAHCQNICQIFDISRTTLFQKTGQLKIFARFYRSNSVQKQEGVGIGLYLARQIISGEGGYIKVASVPGKGSTFSIFLPK